MRQRIITGIIFTLAVLLFVIPSFWLPSLMMIFSIIVGAVSMYELLNAFKKGGFVPNGYLVIIGGIIVLNACHTTRPRGSPRARAISTKSSPRARTIRLRT